MGKKAPTLAEVVVAVGLLAVVALPLIGLFAKLLGSQSKTTHFTVANFVSNKVAERAVLAGPPNWGMNDISMPQTESTRIHHQSAMVNFSYRIIPSVLAPAPAQNPMGRLYLLEIELNWWSDDPELMRIEHGKTSVKTARVVYIEE